MTLTLCNACRCCLADSLCSVEFTRTVVRSRDPPRPTDFHKHEFKYRFTCSLCIELSDRLREEGCVLTTGAAAGDNYREALSGTKKGDNFQPFPPSPKCR